MSDRSLTVIGLILTLIPFVAVFSAWKEWLVFGIGVIILLSVLSRALRQVSKK